MKARVHCRNRSGNVSLALTVKDGDYEYGTRKLIHMVHEIFLVFLSDGPYGDYMIEKTRPNQDQDSSEQSDDRRNGAIADGDGAASLSGYGLGDDHLQRDEWNPQRRTGFELHARASIAVSWL